MTTAELNKLSVAELRVLNKNVVSILKQKIRNAGYANLVNLQEGMTITYAGDKMPTKERFIIEKISSVNATCRSLSDNKKYNIRLADIEPAI